MNNQNQEIKIAFDQTRAASYDKQRARMLPLTEALLLLTSAVLSQLPEKARILCVGVGTGTELVHLAQDHPQWTFTAVDPSAAMLDVCRQRVEENGLTDRCTFHEGYLDSLPLTAPFDGATCFLVTHFLLEKAERQALFAEIASRLHPGGLLVSADLASDTSHPNYDSLFEVWKSLLASSDWPKENLEKLREIYQRNVALLPIPEVEEIIKAGGFQNPVLFLQTGLIFAWYSRRMG